MGQLDQYFPSPSTPVAVYRALVDVLQSDPTLANIPITWDVRRGDQGEGLPPCPREMPWVALVPLEMPVKPGSEGDDEARFRVRIDMAVAGTCWDDLANLASAVRDALRYSKPFSTAETVVQHIQAANANYYWYKQGGIGVRRTESPPSDPQVASPPPITDQVASAVVEFQLFLPTIV